MIKIFRSALATLVLLSLSSEAGARLSGSMELGYSSYNREVNGATDNKSAFNQQYSLLYSTAGVVSRGTLGRYRLDLGYEWAYLDNSENDSSLSSGHILYSGEYKYEPRLIPVSLNLYSKDMSRTMIFKDSTDRINLDDMTSSSDILAPGIPTSLIGGIRTSTGGLLSVGMFNSPKYPGLMELPKLIVRYNEDYVSDLNSITPERYRSRNLSAVSGRGSVWLQYRFNQVTDYLNSDFRNSSTQEQIFTVGNIDNTNRRQWIDISNWIRVSTNAEFSREKDKQAYLAGRDLYTINFFGVATRPSWSARSFNTFTRETTGLPGARNIQYTSKIPLFVNGRIGSDTEWDVRLSNDENRSVDQLLGETIRGTQLATLRLSTYKRSPFTLTSALSFTRNTNVSDGDESKYDLRLETASTRRYSDSVGIYGAYDISYIQKDELSGLRADRVNQSLTGRVVYKLTEKIRLEAEEKLTASFGNTLVEDVRKTNGATTSLSDSLEQTETRDSFIRSLTMLKAAWNPTGRLRLATSAAADFINNSTSNETDTVLGFSQLIEYTLPNFKASADVGYVKRSGTIDESELNTSASVNYTPERNLGFLLRGRYSRTDTGATPRSTAEILQQVKYVIDRGRSFALGKLFEITQQASYLKTDGGEYFGIYTTSRRFTLTGNYYPYRNLFVGATGRYSLLDPGSVSEWLANGVIGLNSPKLQATLEYGYGRRNGATDNRIEKKITANMKKQF